MTQQPDPVMVREVAQLCARARQDPECLYGRLLRENVRDVLECSFPRFCERIEPADLAQMIDRFVAEHPAIRPQFHQVATEFVEFAQARLSLTNSLLCVLEYEWALLAAEIDPARITPPSPGDRFGVAINPVARLVVLPFDATGGDWDRPTRRAHAIYRNAAHEVLTQVLSQQDCHLIELIRAAASITPTALAAQAAASCSPDDVAQWVATNLEFGLLCQVAPE